MSSSTQSLSTYDFVTSFATISSYFVLLLSPLSFLLVIWTVYTKSPRTMSTYKWYMICSAVCLEVWDVIYLAVSMEPVIGFIFVAGGPLRGVALPDLLIRVLFHTLVVFIILTAYCISMLFLYRNCQTSGNRRLEEFLSDFKRVSLVTFFFVFVPALLASAALNLFWTPRAELLEEIKAWNPAVYENVRHRTVFGVKSSSTRPYFFTLILICLSFTVPTTVISGCCTLGCYRGLWVNKFRLTKSTLTLYWKLINALIIDVTILFFIAGVPLVITSIAYTMEIAHVASSIQVPTVWAVCATIFTWYPMIYHAVTLLYITPYRRALIRLGEKWLRFGRKRNETGEATCRQVNEATCVTPERNKPKLVGVKTMVISIRYQPHPG